jgi:hypothetical protein
VMFIMPAYIMPVYIMPIYIHPRIMHIISICPAEIAHTCAWDTSALHYLRVLSPTVFLTNVPMPRP